MKLTHIPENGGVAVPSRLSTQSLNIGQVGTYGNILYTPDTGSSKGWILGHAGIVSTTDTRTVEAYPEDGVRYYSNNWGTRYQKVKGLWVSGATSTQYYNAAKYAEGQYAEPYDAFSFKENTSKWYCSKLAWRGWLYSKGIDLDPDNGIWVFPEDLDRSINTITFYSKGN